MTDPARYSSPSASFVFENRKYEIRQKKRTKRTRAPYGSSPSSKPPPRACRARTPSRLAPPAPSVQRSTPRLQQSRATRNGVRNAVSGGDGGAVLGNVARNVPSGDLGNCDRNAIRDVGQLDGNGNGGNCSGGGKGKGGKVGNGGSYGGNGPMTLVPTPPPTPDRDPAWFLRGMWELASILHFLNVFRPILRFNSKFTIKDLEDALLMPNSLLEEIHIALLKAIRPISRTPINQETWVALLCKKMTEWWPWVAEGAFPLAPYHGDELETYKELTPDIRVIILKALCEARADQEDVRAFIDDMLKKGIPLSHIRKERTGIDMHGSKYWYENDPITGQRLYRELRNTDHKDKPNLRGRSMPPPITCNWETLATEFDEFQSVADKLCSSWNRMEVTIGRRINNIIIPDLKDLRKKRERTLKKQQRQAALLNSYLSNEDLTIGRSKRERKPVKYTFDDYDKSISEAIKITKRWHSSPETVIGHCKSLNGSIKQRSDEEANVAKKIGRNGTQRQYKATKVYASQSIESQPILSGDGQNGRRWRHSKAQRYSEVDFDNAVSERKSGYTSDDYIEGEAVYADCYVKRKRKEEASSDGNDEFKGDDEEEDEDCHDIEQGSSNEELDGQETIDGKQRGGKREIHEYEEEEDEYRDKEEEDEYRDKEEGEDEYRDREEEEDDYRDKEEEEDEYRDEEEDEYSGKEELEDKYRDEEEEEEEDDGHDVDDDNEEAYSDGLRKHYVKQRGRKNVKRRSFSKSHINYMTCEESDEEMEDSGFPGKTDSDEWADDCNNVINDAHDVKQLEVVDDINSVKEVNIKVIRKIKQHGIINDVCGVKPLNYNGVSDVKQPDISNVCGMKLSQCTKSCPSDQHNVVSSDYDSERTWHTDDGNVTGCQPYDSERQIIDEVKCEPCDDKKSPSKLQRCLDLNVVG